MSEISALLVGKSAIERSGIKSREIIKVVRPGQFIKDDLQVNIQKVNQIDGGIEVFAQVWRNGKQIGFGKDGSVDIERFRFFNPPILLPDPNGSIERIVHNSFTKETRIDKLKEDPFAALKESLLHTIKIVGKDGSNIVQGKVGNTTDTFYSTAGGDATIYSLSADHTWANSRAGTDVSVDSKTATTSNIYLAKYSTPDYEMRRFFVPFDTSAIPSGNTVSSAVVSLYQSSTADADALAESVGVIKSGQAAHTDLVGSDWTPPNYTDLATKKTMASLNAIQYWDWTITDLTVIAKGSGFTPLVFCTGRDIDNSAPTSNLQSVRRFYLADQTGTTNDPKLVVVHEAAATGFKNLALLGVG